MGKEMKYMYIIDSGTLTIDSKNIDSMTISELLSAWSGILGTTARKKYIHEVGTLLLQELVARGAERASSIKDLASMNHKLDMDRIDKQVLIQNQNDMIDKLRQQCSSMILEKNIQENMNKSLKTDKYHLQDLIRYQKEQIECQEKRT